MWRAVYALRLTQPDRGVPKILYVTPCDTDTEITFFESRPPWSRRVHFPFSARENLPSRILAITFTFVIDLRAIIDDPIPFYFPGFLSWRSVLKILNKRVVCKLELEKEGLCLELVFSPEIIPPWSFLSRQWNTICSKKNCQKFFQQGLSLWKFRTSLCSIDRNHVSSIHIQRYTPVAI